MDSFFESNGSFMESFEGGYTATQDEADLNDDPLSNIRVDPLIFEGLFPGVGDFDTSRSWHTKDGMTNEVAFQYSEEFVQRRVAQSAFAEPWTGISAQSVDFPTASTLSRSISQSNLTSIHGDETDSGYVSQICKPLLCLQCGKTFKNKAEEKKHSSTHSRPFKCSVKNCTNTKGFATSNDLERHQKDIHLIRPKHGPQCYYRCVLATCSKREKIWSRKDNFKAHISRMHKNVGVDVDHLIARSEMTPTAAEMAQLARAKNAQIHNKNKGKQRASVDSKQTAETQYGESRLEAETSQAAIPLWQTNVPEYLADMPQEAAEMAKPRFWRGRVADTDVAGVVLKYANGKAETGYGYGTDGAWDEMSETSFAYSHESLAFGGGTSDFG